MRKVNRARYEQKLTENAPKATVRDIKTARKNRDYSWLDRDTRSVPAYEVLA